MSKFQTCETIMSEPQHLMTALQALGFKPTLHDQPIQLEGYHGDKRAERANIVIPRAQIGSLSNDVGFVLENGKYRAIISEYDSGRFNSQWLGSLSQSYTETQQMARAKAKGYIFAGKSVVNGKTKLLFHVRG